MQADLSCEGDVHEELFVSFAEEGGRGVEAFGPGFLDDLGT